MSGQMNAILESKRRERARLAGLSFTEKVVLLEKLRDRAIAIAGSALHGERTAREKKAGVLLGHGVRSGAEPQK